MGVVVHASNPSYLGGGDWEDWDSLSSWEKVRSPSEQKSWALW
jgi:hypothetical protein